MSTHNPHDFFRTPAWVTESILPHAKPCPGRMILDPAAGDGAILDVLERTVGFVSCVGIEIDTELAAACGASRCLQGDALAMSWGTPDGVIMNPPFRLAEAFVRKAVAEVAPGGEVWALLRLAFLESKTRYASFWKEHRPAAVHVLSKRPSFTSNGASDKTAYAWFGWGVVGEAAGLHVLPPPNLPRRPRKSKGAA